VLGVEARRLKGEWYEIKLLQSGCLLVGSVGKHHEMILVSELYEIAVGKAPSRFSVPFVGG